MAVEIHAVSHGRFALVVEGEEYGTFGTLQGAESAASWWAAYLEQGGHPLTEDEKRLSRRDTGMGCAAVLREHLGGPARTPDLWDIFLGGAHAGRYVTERGALLRIERLTSPGRA